MRYPGRRTSVADARVCGEIATIASDPPGRRRGGRGLLRFAGMSDDRKRADGPAEDEVPERDPEEVRRWGFTRLGEQLSGLLDPEAALRRGQGIVTGVTNATKDEMMRIVGAEVRTFLNHIDIADLAQRVISGLVVDVSMQVRFSQHGEGPAKPTITRSETKIRTTTKTRAQADQEADEADEPAPDKRKP